LKNLEELYLKYVQRLHLGFISVFVLLQSLLSLSHAVVTWITVSVVTGTDKAFYFKCRARIFVA
jgi:hypothetical protein